MKILVIGATGGSGRATVQELLQQGHHVTAFVRRAEVLPPAAGLQVVVGDVTQPADLDRATPGHDAVVVTLGIHENPVRVRLIGSGGTPLTVRSVGTRNVMDAMRRHGVAKLVVQSSFGVGDTRARLPFKWRVLFALLLRPQIEDHERQERLVRDSDLTWVLAQPVALTDDEDTRPPFTSPSGDVRALSIARKRVASFLATAATTGLYDRQCVALS